MARFDELTTQLVVIEREQLARLQHVAKRLYTEQRMNGDEMRDAAHTITGVLDQAIDVPDFGVPAAPDDPSLTGLARLVRDIVNVTGPDVDERRLVIAEAHVKLLQREGLL